METKKVYVIIQTMIDSFENSRSEAITERVVGYVNTLQEAESIQKNSRGFTKKDCWAIGLFGNEEIKEYKYKELEYFK